MTVFCENGNRISGTKNMWNYLTRRATGSFQERLCFIELLPTVLPHIYVHVDDTNEEKVKVREHRTPNHIRNQEKIVLRV
jgi:hypothetical protein